MRRRAGENFVCPRSQAAAPYGQSNLCGPTRVGSRLVFSMSDAAPGGYTEDARKCRGR